QLTLRTFHVGGTASRTAEESQIKSKFNAKVEFEEIRTTERINEDGTKTKIVLARSAEVRLVDPENSQKVYTTQHIPYGATLYVEQDQLIKKDTVICEWDPYNAVIVTEFEGIARFDSIEEGVTYREEVDDATGFREKVIIESKKKKKIPIIIIEDSNEEVLRKYNLPVGSHIVVKDGVAVKPGEQLVKIPRSLGAISDITGGLPRVTELFEARNPSNPSVISEIDGVISFGKIKRGNREVIVTAKDGLTRKYLVGLSKHILVQEGDFIRAGTQLSDGATAPRDILNIKGPFAVQAYLVNGVQEVYRTQGVVINDKHIEVIVRQMMRRVQILDSGDTVFLEKEAVEKYDFLTENDRIFDKKIITDAGESKVLHEGQMATVRQIREENSQLRRKDKKLVKFRDAIPATSMPVLQGITKASLGTQSWISAASFQETTKVISSAAIGAKQDHLYGLKENVIVGKPIPAGTGIRKYENLIVGDKSEMGYYEATDEDRRRATEF
ncbi:MAG: DNA-directed RNA polymerase subunit beta', partial [Saprospiraceae bacterium]|nr:DNA-directed RNA polymerase subunit beta' [Saprospiraceae bacterium]